MLQRIYLRLEILGYSRAIGAMQSTAGVTKEQIKSLEDGRAEAIAQLACLKASKRDATVLCGEAV